MSASIADIFENYVESKDRYPCLYQETKKSLLSLFKGLQNLPDEIDRNMQELRSKDEEFQRLREKYTSHRRSYAKMLRNEATPTSVLLASSQKLDHDHRKAIQKQDQKIDLAMHMYDQVSKHIERIDSEIARTGIIDNAAWIGSSGRSSANGRRPRLPASSLLQPYFDSTQSSSTSTAAAALVVGRKRTHHSIRSNPELDVDPNEPRYCVCNQVSYGNMVACDSENCAREWFHYACVGLAKPPVGKWFCRECALAQR
ncbi:hypothetical protein BX666DRAFT_1997605 [Dichotomocladium elegans]|nr:hypothetical protein BX666DRAFT_1997605 [Dichotomocladium elegans]